jgi:hypothetical protein
MTNTFQDYLRDNPAPFNVWQLPIDSRAYIIRLQVASYTLWLADRMKGLPLPPDDELPECFRGLPRDGEL